MKPRLVPLLGAALLLMPGAAQAAAGSDGTPPVAGGVAALAAITGTLLVTRIVPLSQWDLTNALVVGLLGAGLFGLAGAGVGQWIRQLGERPTPAERASATAY